MEEELIDNINQYPEGKGNRTIQLFIASASLIVLMSIIWLLDIYFFRVPEILAVLSGLCGVTAFGLSVSGIYIGIWERKFSTNWVMTGLIGHIIIVLAPTSVFVYAAVELVYSIFW